jgi:phosphoribosyl-ATP pyrophosphohydrolase
MTERFDQLLATILQRRTADPTVSYVAKISAKGRAKLAQKLGEEAVELVIAAVTDDRVEMISEGADLMFHLALLLADAGLSFDDIRAELARREGVSGIEEKSKRAT